MVLFALWLFLISQRDCRFYQRRCVSAWQNAIMLKHLHKIYRMGKNGQGKLCGHLFSAATHTLPFRALLCTWPWRGPPLRWWEQWLGKWKDQRSLLCFCCYSKEEKRMKCSYTFCWRLPSHKRELKVWPIFVLHRSFSSIPYQGSFDKKSCSPVVLNLPNASTL